MKKKLLRIVLIAFLIAAFAIPILPATPVYAAACDRQVTAGTDDANRRLDTSTWSLTGAQLAVGSNGAAANQEGTGHRLTNITITQGATIDTAHIHITAKTTTPFTNVKSRISAEDVDDAPTFADDCAAFDARWANRTTARVDWDDFPTWTEHVEYTSPSIVSVIQEIVNRESWASGNDIVIFWDDFEDRTEPIVAKYKTAHSYESNSAYALKLHITYTPIPDPPAVTTSAATLVEETTATLNANLTTLGDYTPVDAYFQYGLTTGYGTDTTEQSKTETGTYLQAIADLSPGTTYHFRAVVKYNANYVYGNDATLNTKPLVTSGVSTITGETSVTLSWTKGSGADTTVIRRSTTAFPTTPASGDSVYAGDGITILDDTLIENQLYYYSLWSKSSADVYSDSYATTSATPSGDVLSPPDVLQIIDVKVFSNYDEHEDQIYVIRAKIIYNAGDPTLDCSDYFNFELLDGTALKAQVAVKAWGYQPDSIYQSTLSAPDWGGTYTVKLRGSDATWGDPPETQWNLTSGDWVGADLTQLDNWVINTAESIQTFRSPDMPVGWSMIIYATTGIVLSDYGGPIFNRGIPGLSAKRPHLFSTSSEFPGSEPREHDTSYTDDPTTGTMTIRNLGPYLTEALTEVADWIGMEATTFGGFAFGGSYIGLALILAVTGAGALIGMAIASPILILGAWYGLVPPALLMLIGFVFALVVIKSFWLRGS